MRKTVCFALILLLLLLTPVSFAVTYPVQRGNVNDDADVLSDVTVKDIETMNDRFIDARFIVVTRHFLGGADVQDYCDNLYKAWNLGENDLLLLLVIGEERYAVAAGVGVTSALPSDGINTLLSSKLRTAFIQDRDYDGAVGSFILGAATQIARTNGTSLNTAGLFGTETQAQNSGSSSGSTVFTTNLTGNWWNSFFSNGQVEEYEYTQPTSYTLYETDGGSSGFSFGKVILIAVVVMFFIRTRAKRLNRVTQAAHNTDPFRKQR